MSGLVLVNDPTYTNLVEQATQQVYGLLTAFATDDEFGDKVTLTFNKGFNTERLETLRQQWSISNFEAFPQIEVRSSAELNGANGAFAAATNTIYLSAEYLEKNVGNFEAIADVVLEEYGHFVDAEVNVLDAAGDEGEIFTQFVRGVELTESELFELKAKDDTATITLDGEVIQIEQNVDELLGDVTNAITDILGALNEAKVVVEDVSGGLKDFLSVIQSAIDNQILTGLPLLGDELKNSTDRAVEFLSSINNDIFAQIEQLEDLVNLSAEQVQKALFEALDQLNVLQSGIDQAAIPLSVAEQIINTLETKVNSGDNVSDILRTALSESLEVLDPNLFIEEVPSVDEILETALTEFQEELQSQFSGLLAEILDEPLNLIQQAFVDAIPSINSLEEIPESIPQNILNSLLNPPSGEELTVVLQGELEAAFEQLGVAGENLLEDVLSQLETKLVDPLTGLLENVLEQPKQLIGKALSEALGQEINIDGLTDDFSFNLNLSESNTVENSLDSDIGLSGLGLELTTDGQAQIDLGFDLNLGFGYTSSNGFFFDTSQADEITINLDASLPDLNVQGKLGFLELQVEDDQNDPSSLDADFTVDIVGDSLSNVSIDSELNGQADVNLDLTASFGDSAQFPTIKTDFELDWNLDTDNLDGLNIGQAPEINFNNIRLDLGSFLSDFAKPVVEEVRNITQPLESIFDVLTEPLPIPNRFGTINLLDIANAFASGTPQLGLIDAIAEIINAVETLDSIDISEDSVFIDLGSFSPPEGLDIRQEGSFDDLSIEQLEITNPLADPLEQAKEKSTTSSNFFASAEGGSLSFPILEQPEEVFKLFLGDDATLFKADLPTLEAEFNYQTEIPVFPLINFVFGGNGGFSADLGFGLDTAGFKSGDPVDIFNEGFFIDNDSNLSVFLGFEAGAGVGIPGAASVDGTAFIEGTIEATLNDPTEADDKVRLSDILENLSQGVSCVFDITGVVEAGANISVELLFVFDKSWELARFPIPGLNFSHGCDTGTNTPKLANDLGGNLLRLNMGPFASDRGENTPFFNEINEAFEVQVGNNPGEVIVSAFGYDQVYPEVSSSINEIVADGGTGDDAIVLLPGVVATANLQGGEGNDILTAGDGSATLQGGTGNDGLNGGSQSDQLFGEQGNDVLNGGDGNDFLDGADDDDILSGDRGSDTLQAGPGDDNLQGGTESDRLIGNLGKDTLSGDEGDDDLSGNEGEDVLFGNDGDDNLQGGSENDFLNGGEGNDNLLGEAGNDTLEGGFRVTIEQENGEPVYQFLEDMGEDFLNGGEGDDELDGGGGDDLLIGESGNDLIDGGLDNDTVNYDNSPDRVIVNIDETTDYDNPGGFLHSTIVTEKLIPTDTEPEFTIAAGTAVDGFGTEDILRNLENIVGSQFDDILIGNEADNHIQALDGNDILVGNPGNDVLDGGNGIDTASYRRDIDNVFVNLEQNVAHDGVGGTDSLNSIENVIGSDFDDSIIGDEVDNIIHAGDDDDIVETRDGDDIIFGQAGADTLYAEDGNDFLVGGEDGDILDGGNDTDTASYFTSTERVAVSLETGKGWAGDAKGDELSNIENLEGSEFEDLLTGDDGENIISGLAGNDLIKAKAGDDWLDGGADDDRLFGEAGNDSLDGQTGDDLLKGGIGNDLLNGGEGNDRLFGQAGIDTLEGDNGNDQLFGGSDDDLLSGSDGNDQLYGQQGEDVLEGGNGNDELDGGKQNDLLIGGDGDDRLFGRVGEDSLEGNAGNDLLKGGTGDDLLSGNEGNDRLFGQNGNDRLSGGSGNDELDGGFGNDELQGNEGNDQLYGQDGQDLLDGGTNNDVLWGGNGSDTLAGQADDDYLDGGRDNDRLNGNAGDDDLYGQEGDDELMGDDGNDYAEGGTGEDSIQGNAGDDRLYGNAGFDILEGGEGHDLLDGGEDDDFLYGNAGSDRLFGREGEDYLDGDVGDDRLEGNEGDDQLLGGDGQDLLKGGDGEDQLEGGADDDWLFGGSGVDLLEGGTGNDRLNGEDDNDQLYGNAGDDSLTGGRGNDLLYGNQGADELDGNEGNDFLYGQAGEDSLNGGEGHDNLYGGGNNDRLTGGNGNDLLDGNDGDDRLDGNAGDDQLDGGVGNDSLSGGDDDDQLYGRTGNDRIDAGSGNDYIEAGEGDDRVTAGEGVDQLYGEAGNDTLDAGAGNDRVEGAEGDDVLLGQEGNDDLLGGSGDDRLDGSDGNDFLSGGSGNDELDGGNGENVLNGGFGEDTLIGGDNSDTFVLKEGYGTDYILNFQLEQDILGLMGLTFEEIEISEDTAVAGRAVINVIESGEQLAVLEGIKASDLYRYHFFPVSETEDNTLNLI